MNTARDEAGEEKTVTATCQPREDPGLAAPPLTRSVAITGAAGFIGRALLRALATDRRGLERVLALDVRAVAPEERMEGVAYATHDVRAPGLERILREHAVDSVVHLASIVTPRAGDSAGVAYEVDVLGTRKVLEACDAAGVGHIVVTSSGAAYGFHADNPEVLSEGDRLRGNDSFAYARHKRIVEEMLAEWRRDRPALRQLVLRPGAILGRGVRNQITDLFEKPLVLGVRGASGPFTFVWDEDVARIIAIGVHERRAGIFNVAGDGSMTLREVAARAGKRYLPLPAPLLRGALAVLGRLGLTQYGPEQVDFIRHRSILNNDALKAEFGYTPVHSTRACFDMYRAARLARAGG